MATRRRWPMTTAAGVHRPREFVSACWGSRPQAQNDIAFHRRSLSASP